MATQSQTFSLGGQELGEYRHVCALFEGPEDSAKTLWPFILAGLDRGDRVIHLVEDSETYRRRLAERHDVTAAIESGQLDIRRWDKTYLPDGRFSGSRMLTFVRDSLREGAALGYTTSRLIGDMEWARDAVPGVEELVAYESELDSFLGQPPDAIVCAYDVRRHSASRIAAILSAHRAAFINGRLQSIDRSSPSSPRDRVLTAASRLFTEAGIKATGVDSLIASAGVAKATFYRHFPSKDDLIVAWLEDPRTRWFDGVRDRVEARSASGEDIIPNLFTVVAEWLEEDDFRGCPYLNTSVELVDPTHPATTTIRDYLREIASYLQDTAEIAGYADGAAIGTALQTILAGSIVLAAAHRDSAFVLAGRDAAVRLLGSAGLQ
jgi:AcrR family transcriptional regulator